MLQIDQSKFNLQFFLSHAKKVKDLIAGALENGGATHNIKTGETFSNYSHDDFIRINSNENKISLFVPTTMNTNGDASEKQIISMINKVKTKMKRIHNVTIDESKAIGSWFSNDLQEVVTENIFLLSHTVDELTESDIHKYIQIANFIKKSMKQEGVSVSINDALLIV